MRQSNKTTDYKKVVIHTVAAYAATMLAGGILAMMTAGEWMSLQMAKIIMVFTGNLALFISCYVTVKSIPKSRLLVAAAMAFGFVVLQCLTLMLVAENGFCADWRLILPLLVALGSGILGSKKKKARR